MCDDYDLIEMAEQRNVSRRRLGALTVGAGLMVTLPRAANALDVVEHAVTIKTPDGVAEAHFVHPASGKYPAVLVWTDIFGLRPAFKQMGKRLAEAGYAVLTPNPYYRVKKEAEVPQGLDFSKPDQRAQLTGLMGGLSPETHTTDSKAFVAWLDTQGAVDTKRKMGTTGYCMGGPITMRTAAVNAGRVGAVGTFHGAALVSDQPTSPHLLVSQMKVQALIAIAASDDQQQPNAKDALRAAFDGAKQKAEIEVYTGTKHGWCPPDSAVYDHDQAEHAWTRQMALFKAALV